MLSRSRLLRPSRDLRRGWTAALAATVVALVAGLASPGDARGPAAPAAVEKFSYRAAGNASGPRCGARFLTLHESFGDICVHATPDASPGKTVDGPLLPLPSVKPKCIGDGVSGARVQAIYAYRADKPNRAASIVPDIVDDYLPHVEGPFRRTSRDEGRELGVRWWMPGCKPSVDVVAIPADLASHDNDNQYGDVVQYLYDNGYQDSNKRYLVWLDEYSLHACGTGGAILPVDAPGPANPNNGDPLGIAPGAGKLLGRSGVHTGFAVAFGKGCWGRDYVTAIHELLHTLGAVQTSSPNSNHAGHCVDDIDIMCYPDPKAPSSLQQTHARCNTRVPMLDCGMDDYFAVSPAVGSYLATHWNIATSQFLGDAALDPVPVPIPRQ